MKTTILTFATLFFLTISAATADNHRTLKISDRLGRTMEILIKAETIFETNDINTCKVSNKAKQNNNNLLIDISSMIKPEQELKEELPIAK